MKFAGSAAYLHKNMRGKGSCCPIANGMHMGDCLELLQAGHHYMDILWSAPGACSHHRNLLNFPM